MRKFCTKTFPLASMCPRPSPVHHCTRIQEKNSLHAVLIRQHSNSGSYASVFLVRVMEGTSPRLTLASAYSSRFSDWMPGFFGRPLKFNFLTSGNLLSNPGNEPIHLGMLTKVVTRCSPIPRHTFTISTLPPYMVPSIANTARLTLFFFFGAAAAIVHAQTVDSNPGVCGLKSALRLRESRMD